MPGFGRYRCVCPRRLLTDSQTAGFIPGGRLVSPWVSRGGEVDHVVLWAVWDLDLACVDLYGRLDPRKTFIGQAAYLVGVWVARGRRLKTGWTRFAKDYRDLTRCLSSASFFMTDMTY